MNRPSDSKLVVAAVIGVIVVSTPIILMLPPAQSPPTEIKLTLLYNAGVLIEAKGIRIYIDPIVVSNYTDQPADVILITHPHYDHYLPAYIDDIYTNDTLFVCPENMTDAVERYDGLGVNPGDSFLVGDINITAFPLYLDDYPSGLPTNHPVAANWTSFIIDIDGFTILHAGDTKYIDEYEDLAGTIDVAFLPIYFDPGLGALNASLLPIVDSINMIQPDYTILTHYNEPNDDIFMSEYSVLVENPECEVLNLVYYTSRTFVVEGT